MMHLSCIGVRNQLNQVRSKVRQAREVKVLRDAFALIAANDEDVFVASGAKLREEFGAAEEPRDELEWF